MESKWPLSVRTDDTAGTASKAPAVVLISNHGRSVSESKPPAAGTPAPVQMAAPAAVTDVRFLTIFHDLEACPISPEVDTMDTVRATLSAISQSAGSESSPAPSRDWRLYKSFGYSLSPEQLEQFADLGLSLLAVGRKADAATSKLRDDVIHFIESHGRPEQHAVALIIDDEARVAGELAALRRAGIRTFVITANGKVIASPAASPCGGTPSPRCSGHVRAGTWNSIMATVAAPDHQQQQSSDIAQHLLQRSAVTSSASAGSPIYKSCKVMPMTPRLTRTVPEATGAVTPEDVDHCVEVQGQESPDGSDSDATTPRANELARPDTGVDRTDSASSFGSQSSEGSQGSGNPFRIVFGHMQLMAEDEGATKYGVQITECTSPNTVHRIGASDLDFNYAWMQRLVTRVQTSQGGGDTDTNKFLVCCRLHQSGEVTDIRLCGAIERVVRNSYGFISHPLFPSNLYFRTTDLDSSGSGKEATKKSQQKWQRGPGQTSRHFKSADDACALHVKDCVAFRVGQKDERVWALRLWKVPSSVARYIADTESAASSGSSLSNLSFDTPSASQGGSVTPRARWTSSRTRALGVQRRATTGGFASLRVPKPKAIGSSLSAASSPTTARGPSSVLAGISNSPRAAHFRRAAALRTGTVEKITLTGFSPRSSTARTVTSPLRRAMSPTNCASRWGLRETATSVANSVFDAQQ
eukprot:INCI12366.1.p1 GENE.INCI12366.1~~INCI12366.1.p1  ORF type:complete len:698 (+),score=95.32 INCI12366.1:174-2267(+)